MGVLQEAKNIIRNSHGEDPTDRIVELLRQNQAMQMEARSLLRRGFRWWTKSPFPEVPVWDRGDENMVVLTEEPSGRHALGILYKDDPTKTSKINPVYAEAMFILAKCGYKGR